MLAWNKKHPANFASKVAPVPTTRTALLNAAAQALCCAAAAVLTRASPVLSHVLSKLFAFVPWSWLILHPDAISAMCWLASVLFAVRAANTLSQWQSTRAAATEQDKLQGTARKLMGLPPAPPKQDAFLKQRKLTVPTLPANLTVPLSPPMRSGNAAAAREYSAAAAGLGGAAGIQKSPGFSPGAAPEAIATPEQLQQFLDSLSDRQQQSPGAAAAGGDAWYVPGYGAGADAFAFPAVASQQDQQEALAPMLPVGCEAPKYRPSWLPRAKAAVHAPNVLSPSSPDEVDELMKNVLGVDRPHAYMEAWVENLREWLACQVIQPLVQQVEAAHLEVNQVLAQFNQPIRLPPIPEVIVSVSSAERQPSVVDIEAMVRYVQGMCQALSTQPGQQQNAMVLAKALVRYDQLLLLLRGKFPADLLPPVPPGYVWSRVQALAEGTCLPAYQWAGGGTSGGRPWSPDLPNDSALVLYLFAAFIEVPGWDFPLRQGGTQPTRGMPLYLGQLPTRPPNQYSAILTHRPDKPSAQVDAILALNLTGPAPMLCFLVEGRIVALTGYHALFHVIIMFALYHKQRHNSVLGNHYLHDPALSLASVVEPPALGSSCVRNQSVFGCWFPPARGTNLEVD